MRLGLYTHERNEEDQHIVGFRRFVAETLTKNRPIYCGRGE